VQRVPSFTFLALCLALTIFTLPRAQEPKRMSIDDPRYEVAIESHDPDPNTFEPHTQFVSALFCPSFAPPYFMSIQWLPGQRARIQCKAVDYDEWMEAQAQFWFPDGKTYVSGLCKKLPVREIACESSDPVLLSSLEFLWDQLSQATFCSQRFGADGTFYTVAAFDRNGLRRRIGLWSPDEPKLGSDLVGILNNIYELAVVTQFKRRDALAVLPQYVNDVPRGGREGSGYRKPRRVLRELSSRTEKARKRRLVPRDDEYRSEDGFDCDSPGLPPPSKPPT